MRGRGCDLRGVWVDRVVAEPGTFADEGVQGKKETRNEFRSREARAGHLPVGWSALLANRYARASLSLAESKS